MIRQMKSLANFYAAFKNPTITIILFIISLQTHEVALGYCMLKLILKFKSKFPIFQIFPRLINP